MSALTIQVNGEARQVAPGTSVRALLDQLQLGPGPVAVEQNGDVVPRAEHAQRLLADGDRIEVVHFVGGG